RTAHFRLSGRQPMGVRTGGWRSPVRWRTATAPLPVGPDRAVMARSLACLYGAGGALGLASLLLFPAWPALRRGGVALPSVLRGADPAVPAGAVCLVIVGAGAAAGIVVAALVRQLRMVALVDPLTNLPNRRVWEETLPRELARARHDESPMSVAVIDVDGLKGLNDRDGHAAGDRLLEDLARVWAAELSEVDLLARFGADEFGLLLPGRGPEAALEVVEHLRAATGGMAPCSAGVATWDGDEAQGDLVRRADEALFDAKRQGRNRATVASTKLIVLPDLEAIERGELTLLYQPIVWLRGGRELGVEALVRWQHPTRGLIPPSQFIARAEESGLIIPLGTWVLQEACRQAHRYRLEHPRTAGLRVSVNLSPRQLAQADLSDTVSDALGESGLPASALCLEITE